MFVFSFMSLGWDVGALNDIGNEYLQAGHKCLLEWTWLYIWIIIHFSFYIISILFLVKMLNYLKNKVITKQSQVIDSLFEITHLTGIICSGAGLFLVFIIFLFFFNRSISEISWIVWIILFYSVFIFIPYGLINLTWTRNKLN